MFLSNFFKRPARLVTNILFLLILTTSISSAQEFRWSWSDDFVNYFMFSPNATITYPKLSKHYPPNYNVTWSFESAYYSSGTPNYTVVVTRMDLEESFGCKADSLRIIEYKGVGLGQASGIPLCGEMTNVTIYNGITNKFVIQFSPDSSWQGSGFSLEVIGYPVSNNTLCGMMHDTNSFKIMSLGDRYSHSLNCSWEVSAPKGKKVLLDITRFDIEYSGPDCPYDRVEVWVNFDRNSSRMWLLARLCGRHYPWLLNTNSSSIQIRFITDHDISAPGFDLKYSIISEPAQRIYKLTSSPVIDSIALSSQLVDTSSPLSWTIRTHPGFRIQITLNGRNVEDALKMYDGPSSEYKGLTVSNKVSSNGFYLTVDLKLPLDSRTHLSFVSEKHITPNRTGIKGEFEVLASTNDTNRHIKYFVYIAPHNMHPRCSIDWLSNIFRKGPNTDNCANIGIAFYQENVSFDNVIGPFCNIAGNYATSIVNAIVGLSRALYVVLYEYKKNVQQPISSHKVPVSCYADKCRGFQISGHMFQTSKTLRTNRFTLHAGIKDNQKYVEIFYNESYDDCIVINVLPLKANITELSISLTGDFQYRICRRRLRRRSGDDCTNHLSTEHTTKLQVSIQTIYGWTKEFTVIELGSVSKKSCRVIERCTASRQNVYSDSCGNLVATITHGCLLTLTHMGPTDGDNWNYVWSVRLSSLNRSTDNPDRAFIELSEIHSNKRSVVKTKISSVKLVSIRRFTYTSLPEVQLLILSKNVHTINLEFRWERVYNFGNRPTNDDSVCSDYKNNSYVFNFHERMTTWDTAKAICVDSGGYLASINSFDELEFLKSCLGGVWGSEFYGNDRGLIFIGLTDSSQMSSYRWEDGSPLTASDWYYPFAFENVLPEMPEPPIDLDKMQPVLDFSQRCVAMVPGNPRFSTNWRKVPCGHFPMLANVYSICEIQNVSTSNRVFPKKSTLSNQQLHCPRDWIFVKGYCFTIFTNATNRFFDMIEYSAQTMCRQSGGVIADVSKLTRQTLTKLLISIGFKESDEDIWVKLSSGNIGCISLNILSQDDLYKERMSLKSRTCQHGDGRVLHVLCETTHIPQNQACLSYNVRCEGGTCLNPDKVCDRHPDCPYAEDEANCVLPNSTFLCGSGESISIFRHCDFYVDCEDGSDESRCVHVNCSQSQYRCTNGQCIPKEMRCDIKPDCIDKSDENMCDLEIECNGFKCPLLGCIPFSSVEDLKPDCPIFTEGDERINPQYHGRFDFFVKNRNGSNVLTRNYSVDCPVNIDHQRCHPDHIKCYPRHKTCLYDHGINNQLLYCSNGGHLRHCEDFECPDNFKCPSSYCVPHHKVCDGVQDCAKGEDEMNCDNNTCPNQLRCGLSNQCVSLEYVCDGQVHCKSGSDDEMFCKLQRTSCPNNCTCQGFGVTCARQDFGDIPYIDIFAYLRVLDFSHNNLQNVTNFTFHGYRSLAYLYLHNNSISFLNAHVFVSIPNLLLLDLSNNKMRVIEPETFLGLANLETLKLHGNPIHRISPGSFVGLSVLSKLNLSSMYIEDIRNNCFIGLYKLTVLNLSNNLISFVDQDTLSDLSLLSVLSLTNNRLEETKAESFRGLSVRTIFTDSYIFCCNVGPQVADCSPPVNSYTSCSDLLPNEFQQGIVWSFAVLALVGNGCVICWRICIEKVHNIPSIFVLNLSISDLLMGVYLLSLSIVNIQYRGSYTINDKIWRHSILCRTMGIIATVSCEMSMFTLVTIAIDRTKRLAYPFTRFQFNKTSAKQIMVLGWILCLFISVIPFLNPSYFGDYYSRNSVCLPFNFADPLGKGWQFSLVIFVVLNALGLLLVVIMYGITYSKVKETQEKAGREDKLHLDVARKLTIVIVTDLLCVIPLTMTNLLSVLGEPINRDMASVLSTVILPINSALNPYLFTFSTITMPRKRKQNLP